MSVRQASVSSTASNADQEVRSDAKWTRKTNVTSDCMTETHITPPQNSPIDSPNGSIPSLALAQASDQAGVRTLLAHTFRQV